MIRLLLCEGRQHAWSCGDLEASCLLGDALRNLGIRYGLIYSHQSPGDPESNNPALNSTLGPKNSSVESHTGEGPKGSPVHREGKVGSCDFPEVCQRVGGRTEIGPWASSSHTSFLVPRFEGEGVRGYSDDSAKVKL